MDSIELTTAQFKVFNRAFDKCMEHCDALQAAYELPREHRTRALMRALSDSIIVAYCVPFFRNDDHDGARFNLPKEHNYFHEPELMRAHTRILELRAGVAHCDLAVTGERYTLESAPGLDEHKYIEYVLSERSVRLIRHMAYRLEGSMSTLGWLKRRDEVGMASSGTSTRIQIDERLEVLPEEDWEALASSWDTDVAAAAAPSRDPID